MLSSDQVSAKIEQIGDGSMSSDKSLNLLIRSKSSHPSLSHPGLLM